MEPSEDKTKCVITPWLIVVICVCGAVLIGLIILTLGVIYRNVW
jgi:preprotein translocase subunit Sec61beta